MFVYMYTNQVQVQIIYRVSQKNAILTVEANISGLKAHIGESSTSFERIPKLNFGLVPFQYKSGWRYKRKLQISVFITEKHFVPIVLKSIHLEEEELEPQTL